MRYTEAHSIIKNQRIFSYPDDSIRYYRVHVLYFDKDGNRKTEFLADPSEDPEIGDICGVIGRAKCFHEQGYFINFDDLYVVWADKKKCIHRAKLYSTLTPFPEGYLCKYWIEIKNGDFLLEVTEKTEVKGLFLTHTFRIPTSITKIDLNELENEEDEDC